MVRISNLDILSRLKENSRTPFMRMAKDFGVSETAVRKRVKRLEEEGVIKNYTINTDPKKMGFQAQTLIGIDTKPESYMPVIEVLKKNKEVINLYSASGDHMILIECWFESSRELSKFVKRLRKIKGVKKICPAVILEKIK